MSSPTLHLNAGDITTREDLVIEYGGTIYSEADLSEGLVFPPMRELRRVTVKVAEAVVREARDQGLGRPFIDAQIPEAVRDAMWEPDYPDLVPV